MRPNEESQSGRLALHTAFPPHLFPRNGKQIGRQGNHCWRAWPPAV